MRTLRFIQGKATLRIHAAALLALVSLTCGGDTAHAEAPGVAGTTDAAQAAPTPPKPKKRKRPSDVTPEMAREINRKHAWAVVENLVRLGEFTVAEAVSKQHLSRDPQDGRGWSLLAKTHLAAGQPAQARKAAEKAASLTTGEENAEYRYLLADARLRQGDAEGAKAMLQDLEKQPGTIGDRSRTALAGLDASSRSLPPLNPEWEAGTRVAFLETPTVTDRNVASVASANVAEEIPIRVEGSFKGALGIMTGYDSNILQVPTTIAPQASGLGSAYTTLSAQAMGLVPFAGGELVPTGMVAYTANIKSSAVALNNLVAGVGLKWGPTPRPNATFGWSVGNDVLLVWMNSNGYTLYMVSNTVRPMAVVRLGDSWVAEVAVPVGLQSFPGVVSSPESSRSGYTYGAHVTIRHVTPFKMAVFGTLGYSGQRTDGVNFRTQSFGPTLGVAQPVAWLDSEVNGSVSYRRTIYPTALTARADSLWMVNAGWGFPVVGPAKLNFSLGNQQMQSSLPDASFSKTTFTLGLNYAF